MRRDIAKGKKAIGSVNNDIEEADKRKNAVPVSSFSENPQLVAKQFPN